MSLSGLASDRPKAPGSLPSSEVEPTVPRRTFDVIEIVEILTHWYAGRSQHELAASLGVDRKTLRKYTAATIAARLEPGRCADGRGGLAVAGVRVVPAADRYPAAAGAVAGDRGAP